MKTSSQRIFILALIQLLGIQANTEFQSKEVEKLTNSIGRIDNCEACSLSTALEQPRLLVSRATPYTSISPEYQPITLEFTNDRKGDLRAVIDLIKEASKSSSHQIAELINSFINKHYSNDYGTFDQSVQEVVDQIFNIVKSENFDASDNVFKSLITKNLNDLEMAYFKAKNPKESIGIFKSFEFSDNKQEDTKKLYESFKSINPFNIQDAVSFILNFIKKHYSSEKGYTGDMAMIIHRIISYVQSSQFEPTNPSNQEKINGWFLQLENAKKDAENQPNKFTPYKTPLVSEDRVSSHDNIIKSISCVDSQNQMDFVTFIIKYLNDQYSGDKLPFDIRSHNTILQFIDYVSSENFEPNSEITVNQIQFFFDQLDRVYDELKDPNTKNNGFPELKWTSNKEEDRKRLLEASKMISNRNRKIASNTYFGYMETYYTKEDRTFDSQIQRIVISIVNMINNPQFKGSDEESINKITYELGQLDYKASLIKKDPKNNKFARPILSGVKEDDKEKIFQSIKYIGSNDKPQVKDLFWDFILLHYGYAGGELNSSLTPIASEIFKTIDSQNFRPSKTDTLNNLIAQLDKKKEIIDKMDTTSNPYIPPEPSDDKFAYIEKLLDSMKQMNNKNRNDIYRTFKQCLHKFYGNPDGTLPTPIKGTANEILNMIKSTDMNPNDEHNFNKISQLFSLLDKSMRYANGGQSPSVYNQPIFTKDKKSDTDNLITSFKNVNQANAQLVYESITDFMNLYYLDQNGQYSISVGEYISELVNYITSQDFDPYSNYSQEVKNKINRVDAAFQESQKQEESSGYQAPPISDNPKEDKRKFIESIESITSSTVERAHNFLDKYFEKHFSGPNKSIHPNMQAKISGLKNTLAARDFNPKDIITKLKVESALDGIERIYINLKNPKSTEFSKIKLEGDKEKDLENAIKSLKLITKDNQKAAEEFYEGLLRQYFGLESGGYDTRIFTKVYEVLSSIQSLDFKQSNTESLKKIKDLIYELDKIATESKVAHITPVYIPPDLTEFREVDWNNFLESLRHLNQHTKEGAIKYAKTLLDMYYRNSNGSMDFKFTSLIFDFLEKLRNKDFEKVGDVDIEDLKQMILEMDKIQADIVEGNEVDNLKSYLFTGSKIRDFSYFLRMIQYITKAQIEDASTFLHKYISYYYGKKDGSLDISIYIQASNMQQYLRSNEFDPKKKTTAAKFRQLNTELEQTFSKSLINSNISPPFLQPMLTGNSTIDRHNTIDALSSTNRGNRIDACNFVRKFLIADFGSKNGGFDVEYATIVTEINILLDQSSTDLSDSKTQVKLDSLFIKMEEASNSKEERKIAAHYKHPIITSDHSKNIVEIGKSFENASDFNQEEISKFIVDFVNQAFFNNNEILDLEIHSLKNQLISSIRQRNFSYKNQDHSNRVIYQLNQINRKYQTLQKAQNAAPYITPIFTDNRQEDRARLLDSFKNIEQNSKNKNSMIEAVEEFIKCSYEKEGSIYSFIIAPKKQAVIRAIKMDSFYFTDISGLTELKRLLNELEVVYNTQILNISKPYSPPELTNNSTKDFESIIKSLNQVTKDNILEVKSTIYQAMKKHFGDTQGHLSIEMNNIGFRITNLIGTQGIDLKDPIVIQKIWGYLKEAEMLKIEENSPQVPKDKFTPPSFTNDRERDFETLIEILKKQGNVGDIDVQKYIDGFLKHHYQTNSSGKWEEIQLVLYNQAVALVTSKNFDLNNRGDLDKLKDIIKNLNRETDYIRNAPPLPKLYVAPTLTGKKAEDLDNLINSLNQTTQFSRQDIVLAFEKYIKAEYENDKNVIALVYGKRTDIIKFISRPENNLQSSIVQKDIRNNFKLLDAEIDRFYKNKPPAYKAPTLSNNPGNDLISLMMSFSKVTKDSTKDAQNAVGNYMNKHFGGGKESYPSELVGMVNAITNMITSIKPEFSFTSNRDTEVLQDALLKLKDSYAEIEAAKSVCNDFIPPILDYDNRDASTQKMVSSLRKVTACNKHQALKFFKTEYLEKFYYENDNSVSETFANLISKIWEGISMEVFDFSDFENLDNIRIALVQLGKEYDKTKNTQSVTYQSFNFTGKISEDTNRLIWSLHSVNSQNSHLAIRQISKFIDYYYSDKNQKIEKDIYDLAEKLLSAVGTPGFNFGNVDTQTKVIQILEQMNFKLKKYQSPGESKYGFIPPPIKGNPIEDQINFFDTISKLTKDQKPSMISYLITLINSNYKDMNGKIKGRFYDLSNEIYNLVYSEGFDPQNEACLNNIREIFRELDKEHEKMLASVSENGYLGPLVTNNYDYDKIQLFESFKFANDYNKYSVIDYIIEFTKKEFSKPGTQLSPELNEIVNQIIGHISQDSFKFSSEDDLAYLRSQLDNLWHMFKKKLNEESGNGYNLILITGDRAKDLSDLILSFNSITNDNKLEAISSISDFITYYYSFTGRIPSNELYQLIGGFFDTIKSDSFVLNAEGKQQLTDQITKIDLKYDTLKKQAESYKPFPVLHFTNNSASDKLYLLKALDTVTPVTRNEGNRAIMNYVGNYFGTGNESENGKEDVKYDELFKPTVAQLNKLIQKPEFDTASKSGQEELNELLNQLERIRKQHEDDIDAKKPFIASQITGNREIDVKCLISDLSKVTKYNHNGAREAALKLINQDYTEKYAYMDYSVQKAIYEVKSIFLDPSNDLTQASTVELIKQGFEKVENIITELLNSENKFTPPELTSDLGTNEILLQSVIRQTNKNNIGEIVNFVIQFLTKHYGYSNGTFDTELYPPIMHLLTTIESDDFDYSDPQVQNDIDQIISDINSIHDRKVAPKKYY